MRQWDRALPPRIDGVRVIAVAPRTPLYAAGRRRILPPLAFGLGVLAHLARHHRDYDVVHLASFPFFPLLAAGMVARRTGLPLVVDWWEVWTAAYWRSYLGPVGGNIGGLVQRLAARVPQHAIAYSRLHAARLSALADRQPRRTIRTLLPTPFAEEPQPSAGHLLFVGRLIPEKRAESVVAALAVARASLPSLRAVIVGDGPERASAETAAAGGLRSQVEVAGFVSADRLAEVRRGALCLVLPSAREGYGLVVLEAAACGVPSVVVDGSDNAATEWIEPGVNGYLAPSASPADLASALLAVHADGERLRRSTARWYADLAEDARQTPAVDTIVALYAEAIRERAAVRQP